MKKNINDEQKNFLENSDNNQTFSDNKKEKDISFYNYGDIKSKNSLEMIGISKEFLGGKIIANDDVSIKVIRNEIHALVGENGSGKSTLMSILFGIYKPTKGVIKINDKEILINTPQIAKKIGIGMVHQHYQLVENMSLIENVILGQEESFNLSMQKSEKKFVEICKKYNFILDPQSLVMDLSIGQKQKLEIIKVLWNDKEIIVFDEPTAALSTDEVTEFLNILKSFKKNGKTVIFISHKLKEVKEIADRLTILRKGKVIKTLEVKKVNIDQISKLMIGELIRLKFKKTYNIQKKVGFEVKNLTTVKEEGSQRLKNISFKVRVGEIVGIAGIGDNGQTELLEAINGLRYILDGKIIINEDIDISNFSINKRQKYISHIPEDRHKYGVASRMNLIENSTITNIESKEFSKLWITRGNKKNGKSWIKDSNKIKFWTNKIIDNMNVEGANDINSPIGNLSGGNQQKFVVGREIDQKYKVLVAGHPTRGLDIKAISNIYKTIISKSENAAVLLSSYELDELLAVCDRILVVFKGEIKKVVDVKKASAQFEIAKAMVGGST